MTNILTFHHDSGTFDLAPASLTIAGWTGRDTEAVAHHIRELQEIGVAPPSRTPLFYRVSAALLTQDDRVEVLGPATSGEAEPVLIRHGGTLWLGLGSDHTDRMLEAQSVAAAKQACAKVCGQHVWPLEEVSDHLDRLALSCWLTDAVGETLYQDGTLAAIRPLAELLDMHPLDEGAVMFCGTLPAIGGIRPGRAFRAELHDPVRDRSLSLCYDIAELPVIA